MRPIFVIMIILNKILIINFNGKKCWIWTVCNAQLITLNPITFMAFSEITLFQRFKIKVFGLTPLIRTRSHRIVPMTWWNIINSCLCLWHYFKKVTVSLIGPSEETSDGIISKCKDNIFRYYKTSDGENRCHWAELIRNPSHCDDIIVVVWSIVEYSGVTMKYWLAARQPGHTFNDRQHFWCSHSKNWSGLITKTNYKSRLIISPVDTFLSLAKSWYLWTYLQYF